MISTKRFSEFIAEFLKLDNEKTKWEFYLHKVFDKSYTDWKKSLNEINNTVSEKEIETTIEDSMTILSNFVPN